MSYHDFRGNENRLPVSGEIRYTGGNVEIYNGSAWGPLGARQAFGNMDEIKAYLDLNGEHLIETTNEQPVTGRTTVILKTRTPQGIEIIREAIMAYGGFYFNSVTLEIPEPSFEQVFTIGGEQMRVPMIGGTRTLRLNGHGGIVTPTRSEAEFVRDLSAVGTASSISSVDQPVLHSNTMSDILRYGVERYGIDLAQKQRSGFTGVFDIEEDKEIRQFKKGKGLFKRGIKKFQALPFPEQVNKIKKMVKVYGFKEKDKSAKLDLGWAGRYEVWITKKPQGERIEKWNKRSDRNPFLNGGDMCLGNMLTTYNQCLGNDNYLEALKIIISVLSCRKDSKGFKRWSECKLKEWSLKRS